MAKSATAAKPPSSHPPAVSKYSVGSVCVFESVGYQRFNRQLRNRAIALIDPAGTWSIHRDGVKIWSALRREHLRQMSDPQQSQHARRHVGEFEGA
jgi:hypothetical protein